MGNFIIRKTLSIPLPTSPLYDVGRKFQLAMNLHTLIGSLCLGRARAGMASSPLWRGGGKIFPNSPDENFSQKVNRKMYRAGVASILSQLAREDRFAGVESFSVEAPKTKLLSQKLKGMGLDSVLLITDEFDAKRAELISRQYEMERNQVARCHVVQIHALAHLILLADLPRQQGAELPEHVLDKPAAVKA